VTSQAEKQSRNVLSEKTGAFSIEIRGLVADQDVDVMSPIYPEGILSGHPFLLSRLRTRDFFDLPFGFMHSFVDLVEALNCE